MNIIQAVIIDSALPVGVSSWANYLYMMMVLWRSCGCWRTKLKWVSRSVTARLLLRRSHFNVTAQMVSSVKATWCRYAQEVCVALPNPIPIQLHCSVTETRCRGWSGPWGCTTSAHGGYIIWIVETRALRHSVSPSDWIFSFHGPKLATAFDDMKLFKDILLHQPVPLFFPGTSHSYYTQHIHCVPLLFILRQHSCTHLLHGKCCLYNATNIYSWGGMNDGGDRVKDSSLKIYLLTSSLCTFCFSSSALYVILQLPRWKRWWTSYLYFRLFIAC
jgi:hypothetical protein